MMKRMILAALAMVISLPAAITTFAQDDDIYFKKPSKKTIYEETADDVWSTEANNDWDLDAYNRRGAELDEAVDSMLLADASLALNTAGTLSAASATDYTQGIAPIHDTIFVIEQYTYCDRIRRFHNPYFGYYRYSPWYDIAYYDPFYWDYCYYDPWWYVSPSFGFHYGSWYWGWDFGYYTGWYGGWYCPYYHPYPHYWYPSYGYGGGGGIASTGGSGIRHGNGRRDGYHGPRNNSGSHIASRGGWRGDGGGTRGASASRNRSYRGSSTSAIASTEGPTLRGRNTNAGRLTSSNLSGTSLRPTRQSGVTASTSNGTASTTRRSSSTAAVHNGSTASSTTTTRRAADNSANRRMDAGMHQNDRGVSVRTDGRASSSVQNNGSYSNDRATSASGSRSVGSHSSNRGSYNVGSSSSPSRSSSSSYGSGSSSSSHSSGSYSGSSRSSSSSGSSRSSSSGGSYGGGSSSGGSRGGGGGSSSGGGGGRGRR